MIRLRYCQEPVPGHKQETRPFGRISALVGPGTKNWQFSVRTTNTLMLNLIFDFFYLLFHKPIRKKDNHIFDTNVVYLT